MSALNHLYIMRAGRTRLFKVGVSVDPARRVKQLQTGNPLPISLVETFPCNAGIDAYAAESTIHAWLKEKGLHAHGEWFDFPDGVLLADLRNLMRNSLTSSSSQALTSSSMGGAEGAGTDTAAFASRFPSVPSSPPSALAAPVVRAPAIPARASGEE